MRHEPIKEVRVEHLDAPALRRLDSATWNELSANALVENPFYSRQVVLAGLNTIDRHTAIEAIAIRGSRGGLLGLFPFTRRRRPFEVADALCNLYTYSSTPLIRCDHGDIAIAAWLDTIQTSGSVPRFWRFQHFHLKSQVFVLLKAVLASRSLQAAAVTEYKRPQLTRVNGGLERHIAQALPKHRRKDIERRIRRLRELGDLRFERVREPTLVAKRLEQFLELENAGWKGSRGTAFLSKDDDAAFARDAFSPHQRDGCQVTIDTLLLDDKPLAFSINLRASNTAFTPKGAYDERFRRYSPGLVLDYLALSAFYEEPDMVDMDSATTQEDHVLCELWNDWKSMGMLLIGPEGWRLRSMAHFEACNHASREFIKKAVSIHQLWRWVKG